MFFFNKYFRYQRSEHAFRAIMKVLYFTILAAFVFIYLCIARIFVTDTK